MGESWFVELGLGGTAASCGIVDFEPFDLTLAADLVDAASDRSFPTLVSMLDSDARGLSDLSDFELDRILDPIDRREREDSFVSDLLNDGYDCKPSLRRSIEVEDWFLGVLEPSFDCCWPML